MSYREQGYPVLEIGDQVGHYILTKVLGQGHFSLVYLAEDVRTTTPSERQWVALKISKHHRSFYKACEEEGDIYRQVMMRSPTHILNLLDKFQYIDPRTRHAHVVLVFEPMWQDLYEFLCTQHPLPSPLRECVIYQLFLGVEQFHNAGFVHSDIKPENFLVSLPDGLLNPEQLRQDRHRCQMIVRTLKQWRRQLQKGHMSGPASFLSTLSPLLVLYKQCPSSDLSNCPSYILDAFREYEQLSKWDKTMPVEQPLQGHLIVKLSDFGNAFPWGKAYSDHLCTRQYQPPEIIAGCPFNHTIDTFSLGCVVFEIVVGKQLFNPPRDLPASLRPEYHLCQMMRTLAPPPQSWPSLFWIKGRYARQLMSGPHRLIHFAHITEDRSLNRLLSNEDHMLFLELIQRLCEPDPRDRLSLTQARQSDVLRDVHELYETHGNQAFRL